MRVGVAPPRPTKAPEPGRPAFRSYRTKFLLTVVPTIVVLNLLISIIFGYAAYDMVKQEVHQKHWASIRGFASALSDTLWHYRYDQARLIVQGMFGNNEVTIVRVLDETGRPIIESGQMGPDLNHLSTPIHYTDGNRSTRVGVLEVGYSNVTLSQRLLQSVAHAMLHTSLSSLALIFLMLTINRRLIAEPLSRVTAAIRSSQADTLRQRVDWDSNDELGELVETFNEMQARLDEGERRRRQFNERLERLYNRTPAMLHSVDREGTLLHVSDHWLVATGYKRQDVIGRKLATFLTPDSAAIYMNETLPQFLARGVTPETPLRLVKYDGSTLDVVLAETADLRLGGKFPISLSVMSDVSRTKSVEREMVRLALTDPVTGLANRRGFVEGLEAEVTRLCRQNGRGVALVMDLDRFKRVNDAYGHAAGDQLLIAFARRLAEAGLGGAMAGRLGGDEFAMFLPGLDGAEGVTFARRLLEQLRKPTDVGPAVIEASASIGVACFPADGLSGQDLLLAADLALYRAKETGRNRVERFERRLAEALLVRQTQEQDVRSGLAKGWFELTIQPIVRLATGRMVGGEALLRLHHPTRGLVMPAEFIPVAEETGLIEELGRLVLCEAARIIPALVAAARNPDFFISVNLSGGQVNRDLPNLLSEVLQAGLPGPSNLVLEIMETALLEDADEVNEILSEISRLGIRFALDDFGTGYSSLNYVDRFPVSMIKVDRSFTRSIGQDGEQNRRTRALMRTTVTLGRELGLPIVAEGIERVEERDRMLELGVDLGQGYLFARPMPARDFLELLGASAGYRANDPDRTKPSDPAIEALSA
ncbi:EAL domain-containing protein [Prosthecodimorpha staleyi]|uniref:EAL domain-containing protein n=1 Tax=Prosthecodimorpha staleyi TaxID=2840188 RepID=A0A947D5G4_9HYPH|nr:EAL domain-containing protein [Prosthecodimorpha staleyi]MBT9290529.1 EAL domain-containing protein [Prosthecodimorpha staleyi]